MTIDPLALFVNLVSLACPVVVFIYWRWTRARP